MFADEHWCFDVQPTNFTQTNEIQLENQYEKDIKKELQSIRLYNHNKIILFLLKWTK